MRIRVGNICVGLERGIGMGVGSWEGDSTILEVD